MGSTNIKKKNISFDDQNCYSVKRWFGFEWMDDKNTKHQIKDLLLNIREKRHVFVFIMTWRFFCFNH